MNRGNADSFDYVIVGAGSAGALLAARLAETPGIRVCVLEAGPPATNPFIGVPAGLLKLIFNPEVTWSFQTEPGPGINGRTLPAIQGRVVGGSASINGMIYVRGQAEDFNDWAQRGNRGWSYEDVLPYFRKTERRVGGGDPRFRGSEGNLPIKDLDWKTDLVEAFIESAINVGIPRNHDYNGENQEGVGVYQFNIGNGRRQNSAGVYLRAKIKDGRVDLRANARATEIIFDGKTARGVRYTRDNGASVDAVMAAREVIVCGGAINSPRLLQVSGVGEPEHLRRIGAPVVQALPGVGANLRDHYTPRMVSRAQGALTINDSAHGLRALGEGLNWLFNRPSILAVGALHAAAFCQSEYAGGRPDIVVTFTPVSFKEGRFGVLDDVPGMTCGTWQLRPESSGYVHAGSRDVFEAPTIQPNYLTAERDRQVVVAGLKLIRRIQAEPSFARYCAEDLLPGPSVGTDDELIDYARQQGLGGYHYCGTCRMGPASDPTAVVDDHLRVHGLDRLRVVDSSIMPNLVSANTNAATMMIAEKGADLIRGAVA